MKKIQTRFNFSGKIEIIKSIIDPRNKLNDLTGKEWIKFTKSWFIEDGNSKEISKAIENHPASYPPNMVREFIKFFTKKNEYVFDPFVGTGSTLVSCEETKRKGLGIELYEKYVKTARSRTNLNIIHGDCIQSQNFYFLILINQNCFPNLIF